MLASRWLDEVCKWINAATHCININENSLSPPEHKQAMTRTIYRKSLWSWRIFTSQRRDRMLNGGGTGENLDLRECLNPTTLIEWTWRGGTQPELSRPQLLYRHHKVLHVVKLWHLNPFRLGTRCNQWYHFPTSFTKLSVYRLQWRDQHYNEKERGRTEAMLHFVTCGFVLFGAWFRSWWIPCNRLQRRGTRRGLQKECFSPETFWIKISIFPILAAAFYTPPPPG